MDTIEDLRVTRRKVLLGSGGLLGAATLGGLVAAPSVAHATDSDARWDYKTDVVCVGSGAAAMTAAVTARNLGAEVMMVEKMPILGGTTGNRSGGVAWIPNHFLLRAQGIDDKKADCLRYMARYSYPQLYSAASPTLGLPEKAYRLIEAFYDNGSRMIDLLEGIGVIHFKQVSTYQPDRLATDYAGDLPEDKVPRGRSLDPISDAGLLEGQNIENYARRGGAVFTAQMERWLRKNQVPILTGHRVTKIVKSGDRVVGIEADNGGKLVRIKARRGVIFGSGGFAHNTELVGLHQPAIYGSCAMPSATGDFVKIAADAGARMGRLDTAWRSQVLLEEALQNRVQAFTLFLLPGDSMIVVNKYGKRVGNEKRSYNDRPRVHFVYDPTRQEYPNQLLFQIFDERSLDAFGGNVPFPIDRRESRSLIVGATLKELQANISQRLRAISDKTGGVSLDTQFVEQLEASIKKFNGYARAGKDLEFERGLGEYDTDWHRTMSPMRSGSAQPVNNFPNITMHPMAQKGPYYAFILGAGALDTCGGPLINERAELISNDDRPITGLYGAGNCVASPTNGAYYGAGGTIGPAMTFGYIAGIQAVRNPAVS